MPISNEYKALIRNLNPFEEYVVNGGY